MLELRVRKRLDSFSLEAELSVPAAGVLALVGESGSGKTTLLRLIAGLLDPDEGRVRLGGVTLVDTKAGVRVPAHRRPVGYVAQDYALFPHLTALENVAFGLRASGLGGRALRARTQAALERLGIAGLAERRPHRLSGGQQQRVALARALALEPAVLLLDEPLAALDLQTRRTVRGELLRLLAELSCVSVFVTHHPAEALTFGGRIAVLEGGRLSQEGPRDELLRRPRSRYVADFLGLNLFPARAGARAADGLTRLATEAGEIVAAEAGDEGEVLALIDPRDITLSLAPPAGSAQNVLRGPIQDLQPEPPGGERVRVTLGTTPPLIVEVTRRATEALGLTRGREVFAAFKATGVRFFR